ncbi:hypothetical protein ABE10_02775, partial [Bacillus toyonensis]|nr:hypothetical protein [Bacillus toyonensis]
MTVDRQGVARDQVVSASRSRVGPVGHRMGEAGKHPRPGSRVAAPRVRTIDTDEGLPLRHPSEEQDLKLVASGHEVEMSGVGVAEEPSVVGGVVDGARRGHHRRPCVLCPPRCRLDGVRARRSLQVEPGAVRVGRSVRRGVGDHRSLLGDGDRRAAMADVGGVVPGCHDLRR